MKKIVIIGAGGFAREVSWLIEDINKQSSEWEMLGFIDKDKSQIGKILNGFPILGDESWFDNQNGEIYAICALGEGTIRRKIIQKLNGMNIKYAKLIHPSVIMSDYNEIGDGTIICAGNILTNNIKVGEHVIINLDCTVGHDAIIESYCTILPSVNVSGNVTLKEGCYVGTGATIIDKIYIGEWTIIGAGSVVVKEIPPRCTAVGVPAKPIKFHNDK